MSSDPPAPKASHTTHHEGHRSANSGRRRHRTLDGVMATVSQADGVGLTDVDALTTLLVRTDNSLYQITILKPYAREVLVQGGAFFPARTRACLSGSSFGGSCLKLGWVGIGLHLEFHTGDQWVITSHVRSIAIESATGRPC